MLYEIKIEKLNLQIFKVVRTRMKSVLYITEVFSVRRVGSDLVLSP